MTIDALGSVLIKRGVPDRVPAEYHSDRRTASSTQPTSSTANKRRYEHPYRPYLLAPATLSGVAMAKVEGSNPFIRLSKSPVFPGVSCLPGRSHVCHVVSFSGLIASGIGLRAISPASARSSPKLRRTPSACPESACLPSSP